MKVMCSSADNKCNDRNSEEKKTEKKIPSTHTRMKKDMRMFTLIKAKEEKKISLPKEILHLD